MRRSRAAGVSEAPQEAEAPRSDDPARDHDGEVVASPVAGGVWAVHVAAGDVVRAGQALVVVESMKMEFTVTAARAGRVVRVLCTAGQGVAPGQALVLLDPDDSGSDSDNNSDNARA